MKNTNLIYAFAILFIAISASSCCSFLATSDKDCNDQRRKLKLVKNIPYQQLKKMVHQEDNCEEGQNKMCLSNEEKDVIMALRASDCQTRKVTHAINSGKICKDPTCEKECLDCCQPTNFCAISVEKLKEFARSYRNDVWSKTSSIFNNANFDHNALYNGEVTDNLSNVIPVDKHNVDTRFLDINIDQMISYICTIKNSPDYQTYGINKLRFVYIKYTNSIAQTHIDNGYVNKHSLAIFPVASHVGYNKEFTDSVSGIGSLIWDPALDDDCQTTTTQNHGLICPPPQNCPKNGIIHRLDSESTP